MSADVVIVVRGGVADVAKKLSGLSVEIRDYDVDKTPGIRLRKDSYGQEYLVSEWESATWFDETGEDK